MSVFEVSPEGFREQNIGRPPAQLVRELIQNVFDEDADNVDVTIRYTPEHLTYICVKDNVAGGIRDPRLVFTIFQSDKQDSPTKRGRMGRGLKEMVSVADRTLIITEKHPAIEFIRLRKDKWERNSPRKNRPLQGTVVECWVRAWKKSEHDEIIRYLRQMRPPDRTYLTINGHDHERKLATETYDLNLTTVMYEDVEGERVQRDRKRSCRVDLFPETETWLYEMGIPVERISYPLSIDVGQRVPLRERRDTVTEAFRRELFGKLLDVRVEKGLVTPEEMKDNHVLTAAAAKGMLSEATKQKIVAAWTEGRPYASTSEALSSATGMHIRAMPLRALPEAVRELTKEVGINVKDVMAEMTAVSCRLIEPAQQTPAEQELVAVWTWLAQNALKKNVTVEIRSGRPSTLASFDQNSSTLTLYRENLGQNWFVFPLGPHQLALFIHEMAHWAKHEDSHGFDFHSDAEQVGGRLAAFLLLAANEIRKRWP